MLMLMLLLMLLMLMLMLLLLLPLLLLQAGEAETTERLGETASALYFPLEFPSRACVDRETTAVGRPLLILLRVVLAITAIYFALQCGG